MSDKKSKDFLTLDPEPTIMKIAQFLGGLGVKKFYGKVIINIEAGEITLIRQEQNFLPSDLSL